MTWAVDFARTSTSRTVRSEATCWSTSPAPSKRARQPSRVGTSSPRSRLHSKASGSIPTLGNTDARCSEVSSARADLLRLGVYRLQNDPLAIDEVPMVAAHPERRWLTFDDPDLDRVGQHGRDLHVLHDWQGADSRRGLIPIHPEHIGALDRDHSFDLRPAQQGVAQH